MCGPTLWITGVRAGTCVCGRYAPLLAACIQGSIRSEHWALEEPRLRFNLTPDPAPQALSDC